MNHPITFEILAVGSNLEPTESEKTFLREALNKTTNWDYVLERAIGTHLAPILHKTFYGLDIIPPSEIKEGLKNAFNQVLVRNIILQQQFKDFAKVLNEHQIPLVPLKGIYLSEVIYKDIGLRHLSDIDVLIKEQDLDQVCELMGSAGWAIKASFKHSKIEDQKFAPAHPYTLIKNQISIELHTHLYNSNQGADISKDQLWHDTHSERFLEVEIRQFSNEMLLQHLCLHLYKHLFGYELKIISFCDIREFLNAKGDSLVWERFHELAVQYDCKKEIGQVLFLCHSYWNVEVPEEFLNIQISKIELEERFRGFMTGASRQENHVIKNKLSAELRNFSELPSSREKLAFIVGFTFPTAEFMRQCYGVHKESWLLPWYAYRPIELSVKIIKAIINKR